MSRAPDRITEADRARLEEPLAVANQQLEAADLLWPRPTRATSVQLLARAAEALEQAAAIARAALPATSAGALPTEADMTALREARAGLERMPAVDAQLSRADLLLRQEARRLVHRLLRRLRRATATRRAIVVRRVVIAAAVLAAVAIAILAATVTDHSQISASGSYPAYEAERAADHNPATEWMAPEGQPAWLEIRLRRPLDVTGVRVVNVNNAPYNDRATKDLDVELYRGDQRLADTHVRFNEVDPGHNPRDVAISGAGATRVRFVLASFHGKGAGLADVEIQGAPSRAR